MTLLALQPVEEVEITTIADNYTDILLGNQTHVVRHSIFRDNQVTPGLLAEHGFSLLIKVRRDGNEHVLLLDGGWSELAVPYNLRLLGIDTKAIEAIILSHGHMDHFGGLTAALRFLGHQGIPLYCHPEVFREDRYLLPGRDKRVKFPVLTRESLVQAGALLQEQREPGLLAENLLALTGEIPRVTDFETGMANAVVASASGDVKDPFNDDQGLIINVNGKGLVVISGCAHAGIINTIIWAQKLTGVTKLYAVLGGFHLSGPAYRKIIEPTAAELERLEPEVLVPMHCTGWKTIQLLSQRFPRQFIPNSVGSRFTF